MKHLMLVATALLSTGSMLAMNTYDKTRHEAITKMSIGNPSITIINNDQVDLRIYTHIDNKEPYFNLKSKSQITLSPFISPFSSINKTERNKAIIQLGINAKNHQNLFLHIGQGSTIGFGDTISVNYNNHDATIDIMHATRTYNVAKLATFYTNDRINLGLIQSARQ